MESDRTACPIFFLKSGFAGGKNMNLELKNIKIRGILVWALNWIQ